MIDAYAEMKIGESIRACADDGTERAVTLVAVDERSGFDSMAGIATHLHLEMMVARHAERSRFTFEIEPDVLPTPNRFLPDEVEGYVVNPYPYTVEWFGCT